MSRKEKTPFAATLKNEPTLSSFRQVTHHRFGPGLVLREFDDGNHKVEVEFPSVGIKLLLASYVQDVREPGNGRSARATLSAARRGTP